MKGNIFGIVGLVISLGGLFLTTFFFKDSSLQFFWGVLTLLNAIGFKE